MQLDILETQCWRGNVEIQSSYSATFTSMCIFSSSALLRRLNVVSIEIRVLFTGLK